MKKKNKSSHKPALKKQGKAKPGKVKKAGVKIVAKKQNAKAKASKKVVVKQAVKTVVKNINKMPVKPVKKAVIPLKPIAKVEEPKPKGLYSIEYELNSSPDVLFEFISTPEDLKSGLPKGCI